MNVYRIASYKEFFKIYIEENDIKGIMTHAAKNCGCDRSYFSQMLNGKVELTPDHIIQFCENMQMPEAEAEYLLLLLLRDRSASAPVKRKLQKKLDDLRREHEELSKKVSSKESFEEISAEQKSWYYSAWYYSAIHIMTSIPEYQNAISISQALNLPPLLVQEALNELLNMKLVKKEKDRFIHSWTNVYLRREDPWVANHHMNWRLKSIERSREKSDIHYTDVFSVSREDVDRLRELMVEMIEKQRKLVAASGTEVAGVLCFDFFKV